MPLAFVPTRADFAWNDPPAANFVDELVWANLRRLRMNPAELCDDSTFLRRAYLDLLNLLPTAAEARRLSPRPVQTNAPCLSIGFLCARICHGLGAEMVGPAAQRREDARPQGGAGVSSLDRIERRRGHASRRILRRTAGGPRQHIRVAAGELLPRLAIPSAAPKPRPKSFWACGCNVPNATTTRSSAGRRTIIMAGLSCLPGCSTRLSRTAARTKTTRTSSTASRSSTAANRGKSNRHAPRTARRDCWERGQTTGADADRLESLATWIASPTIRSLPGAGEPHLVSFDGCGGSSRSTPRLPRDQPSHRIPTCWPPWVRESKTTNEFRCCAAKLTAFRRGRLARC